MASDFPPLASSAEEGGGRLSLEGHEPLPLKVQERQQALKVAGRHLSLPSDLKLLWESEPSENFYSVCLADSHKGARTLLLARRGAVLQGFEYYNQIPMRGFTENL